jgi:hypothetical protein
MATETGTAAVAGQTFDVRNYQGELIGWAQDEGAAKRMAERESRVQGCECCVWITDTSYLVASYLYGRRSNRQG